MIREKDTVVVATAEYVRRELEGTEPGHDWWHTMRVWKRARNLQKREGGDLELIELAALLHDVNDYKFRGGDIGAGPEAARVWLVSLGYPEDRAAAVASIIGAVHFKGPAGEEHAESPEHAVVQDADRLDALGAIGIARAFSFGGHFGREMLDPGVLPRLDMGMGEYQKSESTTINHFFEKLLLLQDRMLTETGGELAREAYDFMLIALSQGRGDDVMLAFCSPPFSRCSVPGEYFPVPNTIRTRHFTGQFAIARTA